MSEKKELSNEELEKVTGGAYVEDGYLYYQLNGQNKKRQILAPENDIRYIVETLTEGGITDEEIIDFFNQICTPFGPEEDC